jgi:hypothetical protein
MAADKYKEELVNDSNINAFYNKGENEYKDNSDNTKGENSGNAKEDYTEEEADSNTGSDREGSQEVGDNVSKDSSAK